MQIIKRFILGIKLFWFGVTKAELFSENVFNVMAKLFENVLMVAEKDKPFTTHLFINKDRIVSFWMYPGIHKNPTDRIVELLGEIDALKEVAAEPELNRQNLTAPNSPILPLETAT